MTTTLPAPVLDEHPIIEPLGEATQDLFTPLPLRDNDFLLIETDEKGEAFEMRPFRGRFLDVNEDASAYAVEAVRKNSRGDTVLEVSGPPSWASRQDFFRRIPQAHQGQKDFWQRNQGEYTCAATDYTCIVTHHSWPQSRLVFGDDNARLLYTFLLKRFMRQTIRAQLQSKFKLAGEVPVMPDDYYPDELRQFAAADYQKTAMMMSLGQEGTALFMDRGTGKTYTTIDRICLEAHRTRRGKMPGEEAHMMRVLVIAPLQVRLNWQEEFTKFAWVGGKVTVLRGGKEKRVKILTHAIRTEDDCDFSAVIVSYDTAARDVSYLSKLQWDLVVLDESHRIKSSQTKRWKQIKKLRAASRRRQILTGTPYANSIFDLYTQLEFLGEGLSGFSSFRSFMKFHGKFQKTEGGRTSLVGMNNIPLMRERLARLSFAVSKEEAGLKLPPKVYDTLEVEMTRKQAKFYEQMATQLAVEIEDMMSGALDNTANRAMTAENILTKLLRLAQITSGHVVWDATYSDDGEQLTEKRVQQIDPEKNPKVVALVETLQEELAEDPLAKKIVWAVFVPDIKEIEKELTRAFGADAVVTYYGATSERGREEAIARFNCDPNCRVMIANPQTAGEGLNLLGYDQKDPDNSPTYCDHQIVFSANWSHVLRAQLEDRAHRRGTRTTVRVTDLVVPHSIDTEIRARVQGKAADAAKVNDIKDILESVLGLELNGFGRL